MAVFQTIRNLFVPPDEAEHGPQLPAPPTTYIVRPLSERHVNELIRLNMRCFKDGENYTKHTFAYLLNEPNALAYRIVTAGGQMAGFLCVLVGDDGAAHITTIGVAPEHRRRDLAKRLLRHLEYALKIRHIATIMLEVRVSNLSAQKLYLGEGYSIVQRIARYYNNGEDGFLMIKSLR